jgi:hypothetical protein
VLLYHLLAAFLVPRTQAFSIIAHSLLQRFEGRRHAAFRGGEAMKKCIACEKARDRDIITPLD